MTRNHSIKRFLSGTVGAVMFLSALPAIAANAAVGTTVLTYEDYEVSYAVTDEWNGGQNVLITVTNLGDESLYNWAFQYDAGGSIEGLYNAVVFENEDTDYIVKNNGWNFELAPQRSVSFGYTMRGEDLSVPTDFELRSERVDVTEGYDVEIAYDDVWQDGMRGRIIVTNTTEQPMEGWTLGFNTNFQVEYVWNGRVIDTDGNHYVAASEAWTQYLAPGQSKEIGFVGSFEPGTEPAFSDYEFTKVRIKGLHENDGPIIEIDMDTDNIDLGYIENLIHEGLITANFDRNSHIRAIDGKFTNKPLVTAEDAAHILNCAHTLFDQNFHADAEDITITTNGDETFFKYTAKVNGVEVQGSQIILSAKNGVTTGMTSTYNKQGITAGTTASITAEEAADAAFAELFAKNPRQLTALKTASGLSEEEAIAVLKSTFEVNQELVLFPVNNQTLALTWKVSLVNRTTLTADTVVDYDDVNDYAKYLFGGYSRSYYVYADGQNAGTVYYSTGFGGNALTAVDGNGFDLNDNVRVFGAVEDNSVYEMYDSARNIETCRADVQLFVLAGQVFVNCTVPGDTIASASQTFSDKNAVSAHANMSDIYDYYLNVLNRDSYDGQHSPILLSTGVRMDVEPFVNAMWFSDPTTGAELFMIGDAGPSIKLENAVDILAHEYQHAVTQYTAGLLPLGEAATMNEAYSDIFGALIEGKSYTDPGFATIGEDSGLIIRSMADPESILDADGNPTGADHYSDMSDPTFQALAAEDEGGVHLYSTIFSRAAYLMMTDAANASVSYSDWAKIFYNSLDYLTSGSEFTDGRYAVVRAAKEYGFDDPMQEAIKRAFDTVGITEPECIRIVLRWGETPSDLDSHLIGPRVTGNGDFHTYYIDRNYYVNDTTYTVTNADFAAELDYDDTTSYGPEITTIHELTEGDYYFYIHDFTNLNSTTSDQMSQSGVTVKIYRAASSEIMYTEDGAPAVFTIDTVQPGTLWKVCKISISADGAVTITPEGDITFHSNPSTVGA